LIDLLAGLHYRIPAEHLAVAANSHYLAFWSTRVIRQVIIVPRYKFGSLRRHSENEQAGKYSYGYSSDQPPAIRSMIHHIYSSSALI
jgi:hypothetical protein